MNALRQAGWGRGLALAVLVLTVAVSSGCSAFRGSRKLDMTPFAENTAIMFGEAAKVSRGFQAQYLKPYVDVPEVAALGRHGEPIKASLRALVMYSNQLVALNSAPKSQSEKVRLLSEYLDETTRGAISREELERLEFTPASLDSLLAAVRTAPTLLDAIAAATPLADGLVAALLHRLDELNVSLLPAAIRAIDTQIDLKYSDKRQAYVGLTSLQARYSIAACWLYDAMSGNAAAIDSLLHVDPSVAAFIPTPASATPEQFAAVEAELVDRLNRINDLIENMATERHTYVATKVELEAFRVSLEDRIRVATNAVVIWGRAHRNLGQGVTVPPMVNVSSMARDAVKSVVP